MPSCGDVIFAQILVCNILSAQMSDGLEDLVAPALVQCAWLGWAAATGRQEAADAASSAPIK